MMYFWVVYNSWLSAMIYQWFFSEPPNLCQKECGFESGCHTLHTAMVGAVCKHTHRYTKKQFQILIASSDFTDTDVKSYLKETLYLTFLQIDWLATDKFFITDAFGWLPLLQRIVDGITILSLRQDKNNWRKKLLEGKTLYFTFLQINWVTTETRRIHFL